MATVPATKLEGEKLLIELSKFTAKAGRILLNKGSKPVEKDEARTALGLLNHAQGLVGTSDRSARRLLAIAKRAL